MAKTLPVILGGVSALLILSGVGTWRIADPANTFYNQTMTYFGNPPTELLIDPSSGNLPVLLGIIFAILAVVAYIYGPRGRGPRF